MKNERLFQIVNILIKKKSVTAPELAEKFGVSIRTIYRDIETLSLSGVPIYTTPGKNGGIRILEDYKLDKTFFTEEEQLLLLQALENQQLIGEHSEQLWLKLSALFQKQPKQWLKVDISRWGEVSFEDSEKFDTLKQLIFSLQVAEISYCGVEGDIKKRRICPLQLVYKSKDWYVFAWCIYRKDYRLFKLNRILKIRKTDEVYEESLIRNWQEEIEIENSAYVHLRLHFSKEIGYRVYDEFPVTAVEKDKSGDFLVTMDMPAGEWIYGYLLSFGNKVKVIEPESVKKEICKKAKELLEEYHA